jgi:hypothetical protein
MKIMNLDASQNVASVAPILAGRAALSDPSLAVERCRSERESTPPGDSH